MEKMKNRHLNFCGKTNKTTDLYACVGDAAASVGSLFSLSLVSTHLKKTNIQKPKTRNMALRIEIILI